MHRCGIGSAGSDDAFFTLPLPWEVTPKQCNGQPPLPYSHSQSQSQEHLRFSTGPSRACGFKNPSSALFCLERILSKYFKSCLKSNQKATTVKQSLKLRKKLSTEIIIQGSLQLRIISRWYCMGRKHVQESQRAPTSERQTGNFEGRGGPVHVQKERKVQIFHEEVGGEMQVNKKGDWSQCFHAASRRTS